MRRMLTILCLHGRKLSLSGCSHSYFPCPFLFRFLSSCYFVVVISLFVSRGKTCHWPNVVEENPPTQTLDVAVVPSQIQHCSWVLFIFVCAVNFFLAKFCNNNNKIIIIIFIGHSAFEPRQETTWRWTKQLNLANNSVRAWTWRFQGVRQ